jgi:hypothetical protein
MIENDDPGPSCTGTRVPVVPFFFVLERSDERRSDQAAGALYSECCKPGTPSRFSLRTHNERPGKIDRLG